MLSKKSVKKKAEAIYKCRMCDKNKAESGFFKCAIDHKSFICKDCIKEKYNALNSKCEKYIAIFICAHYLNIAYYSDIYQTLQIGEGIGHYVRQMNLIQNQNPDSFEEGIIKNNIIDYTPKDLKGEKIKEQLTDIISKLEAVKNDV